MYLYRAVGASGRMPPQTSIATLYGRFPPAFVSEITSPPVGSVFSPDPHPLLAGMREITTWGEYGFGTSAFLVQRAAAPRVLRLAARLRE
jgi:hypothetical protein